jgi:signal transduction histidine kinase
MFGKKYLIAAIGFFPALLTVAHVLIFRNLSPHVVLEELYYIPIFLAALRYGLKGALATFLFASLLYLPFFGEHWSPTYPDLIDRVLHLIFSGLFALLAGYLIDRDRKMQQQAEQDRSLRGVGQAATAIVHDLRNPLVTIQGFAQRIREKKGDPVQAAQTICESAENMQRIVYDVLDFARPMQLARQEEEVGHLLRQSVDFCATKAKAAGVELTAELPDRPLPIVVDRIQVERALVNLINNAVEASARGQRVVVSVVPRADSLRIVIRDQGAGMDSETVKTIFTPFYTRKSGGTGLGMSIAKRIVDSHAGRLTVRSRPGRGTTVTVELPRTPGAEEAAAGPGQLRPAAGVKGVNAKRD